MERTQDPMTLPTRMTTARARHRLRHATSANRDIVGRILSVAAQVFLVAWAIFTVYPLIWAVLSSFKSNGEIFSSPWSLPHSWALTNFEHAWTESHIGTFFLNTVIVVGAGVVLTILLSAMVAYVLAMYEFPGNKIIFYTLIASMMFPGFLALVPLFQLVGQLHMLNTYQGLILVYATHSMPLAVFFLRAFFRSLPKTLAEAALVDGCSHASVFFRVMLPMSGPGLISIGIFTFLQQWNQYILPLVLNTDEEKYVIAQGLANLAVNQGYRSDWGGLFAGLTLSMLPVLALYVVFNRRLRAGLTINAGLK